MTALTVGRLTRNARAATLTDPPLPGSPGRPVASRSPAPGACLRSGPLPRRGEIRGSRQDLGRTQASLSAGNHPANGTAWTSPPSTKMAYSVPVATPAAGGAGTRAGMLPTRMSRSMSVPNSTSIAIIRPSGSRWISPTSGSPAPKGGDESRGLPGGVQNSVSRFYKGGLSTVSPPRSPETWKKGATPY